VTELLSRSGFHIGDELLGASQSNFFGHFEDEKIVRFHDSILALHDMSWLSDSGLPFYFPEEILSPIFDYITLKRSVEALWAFKDPRVCLFLDFWNQLLPDAYYLIVLRHPVKCVASLLRRHGDAASRDSGAIKLHESILTDVDGLLRCWIHYNNQILGLMQNSSRWQVVNDEDLLENRPVLNKLSPIFPEMIEPKRPHEVFRPDLLTMDSSINIADLNIWDEANTLWEQLISEGTSLK